MSRITGRRSAAGAAAALVALLAGLVLLPGTAHAANNSTMELTGASSVMVRTDANGGLAALVELAGCEVRGDRTVNTADDFSWTADADDPADPSPRTSNFVCDGVLQIGGFYADVEIHAASASATTEYCCGDMTLTTVSWELSPQPGSFANMPATGCEVAFSSNLVMGTGNFVHTNDKGWFTEDGWNPSATITGCWDGLGGTNWNTTLDFYLDTATHMDWLFNADFN